MSYTSGRLHGDHPGYLALCSEPGCDWRRFIHEASAPASTCPRHPHGRHMPNQGEQVTVRCFTHRCPSPSVPVVYQPTVDGPETFLCPTHR